jgi:hypothetical protein
MTEEPAMFIEASTQEQQCCRRHMKMGYMLDKPRDDAMEIHGYRTLGVAPSHSYPALSIHASVALEIRIQYFDLLKLE